MDPLAAAAVAPRPWFRLAIPAAAALPWREGCRRDGWTLLDMDLAAQAAWATPAIVATWRVIQGPVPLSEVIRIEVERPGGVWRELLEWPTVKRNGDQAVVTFEGETFAIERQYHPLLRELGYWCQRSRSAA
jgi:hypothetical protein